MAPRTVSEIHEDRLSGFQQKEYINPKDVHPQKEGLEIFTKKPYRAKT
jgi:hypothetical protein